MSSPSSIQSESYKCSNLRDNANSIIYNLNTNFNSLSASWHGNSYQAFNVKFMKLVREVKNSSDQFYSLSRDLNYLADRVEENLKQKQKKSTK